MKNDRKHYTAAEKVAVLKRHLLEKAIQGISGVRDSGALQHFGG
jgi:hypothetical protein